MFLPRNKYAIICFLELAIVATLLWHIALRLVVAEPSLSVPAHSTSTSLSVADLVGRMIFVGDMMFDRSIARIINEQQDPLFPFAHTATWLRSADITMGNLEGPISERGTRQGSIYSFRFAPTSTIAGLRFAGFDLVSLANNHIWDYGSRAALDTLSALKTHEISSVGFGQQSDEANGAVIKTVAGATVAFLGFTDFYGESARATESTPGLSFLAEELIRDRVRTVKKTGGVDVLVVALHWGEEYKTEANERQRRFARELIDAGADLIVGHHPHVAQEVEKVQGGIVAYSLGNFIFDQNFSPATKQAQALEIVIQGKRMTEARVHHVSFTKMYQPIIGSSTLIWSADAEAVY